MLTEIEPGVIMLLGERHLTLQETAKRLSASVEQVRSWQICGQLPRPIKLGRARLTPENELRDWIAKRE